jgi:hypothetical protein
MSWLAPTGGFESNDQSPDYLYYNLSIINNRTVDVAGGENDPEVVYNETRSVPLLKDASKYDFSIVRFAINGPSLNMPLFIPQIQIGQSDEDLTVYSITLDLSANYDVSGVLTHIDLSSQQYIEWSPEYTNQQVPKPPLETQEIADSKYYWTSTYSHWLGLVNETFQKCRDDISNQLGALYPTVSVVSEAPYMLRDPGADLFSIYCDTYGFGEKDRVSKGDLSADEQFSIYFNSNMYGLFANFKSLFIGQETNGGREWEILVENFLGQNIGAQVSPSASPAPTTKYYIISQDYTSTTQMWNPISAIVFSTNMIPIIAEQTGEPLQLGQSSVGSLPSSQGFQPIITDIAFDNSPPQGRQYQLYLPTAQYRYASMGSSKIAIRNIDMKVFFKARLSGELIPMTMFNLSSVDVKILFRKKSGASYEKY